jgi:ElaB/YqjD/DUF883 family membrane-anchored ribosome-binding protein
MSDKKKQDPGLAQLERAKVEAELSKKRLTSTLSTLQERLKPGNLASEAWDGVRDKGGELADNTMQSVKDRPLAASGIVAAIAIFLARNPLMRLASRVLNGDDTSDLVTTRVSKKDDNYDLAAPAVSRSIDEGVSA